MTYRCFDLTIENRVAHIMLKRGDELNTMVPEFWTELPAIVRDIDNHAPYSRFEDDVAILFFGNLRVLPRRSRCVVLSDQETNRRCAEKGQHQNRHAKRGNCNHEEILRLPAGVQASVILTHGRRRRSTFRVSRESLFECISMSVSSHTISGDLGLIEL